MSTLAQRRSLRKKYEEAAATSKPGEGSRFAALEASAKASGATNPAAVAAEAGRKKYGKARFQKMATAGKRHKTTTAGHSDISTTGTVSEKNSQSEKTWGIQGCIKEHDGTA